MSLFVWVIGPPDAASRLKRFNQNLGLQAAQKSKSFDNCQFLFLCALVIRVDREKVSMETGDMLTDMADFFDFGQASMDEDRLNTVMEGESAHFETAGPSHLNPQR